MTAAEALKHPYFTRLDLFDHQESKDAKALESQMLDPRMDFNISKYAGSNRPRLCFGDLSLTMMPHYSTR